MALAEKKLRRLIDGQIELAEKAGIKIADRTASEKEKPHERTTELRKDAVSWREVIDTANNDPERIRSLRDSVQNAVEIVVGMEDDPNSPRKWFGSRVLEDSQKTRSLVAQESWGKEKASSQSIVAEMIVDILGGNFDFSQNPDPIIIIGDGEVSQGQHRAAALAMIYGNNWRKPAEAAGFIIDRKQ